MIRSLFVSLAIIFSMQAALASDISDAQIELQTALKKIDIARQTLRLSVNTSQTCLAAPDAKNCVFQDYCNNFANKTQEAYLYKDADGHVIPNFLLLNSLEQAQSCLGKRFAGPMINNDPFLDPKLFSISSADQGLNREASEKVQQFREDYKRQMTRVEKIYSDVIGQMKKVLESRRTAENSDMIDRVKQRLEFVTLKLLAPSSLWAYAAHGCELPNAFYYPETHEMMVCPQVMNMPDAALFGTIAHELGHSFDPCSSISAIQTSKADGGYSTATPDFIETGGQSGRLKIPGIPPEENPFRSVISCLQTPASMRVKVPTREELLKGLEVQVKQDEDNTFDIEGFSEPQKAKNDYKKKLIEQNYDTFKFCKGLTKSGHMQESFADWIAEQTVSQKVSGIPESAKAKEFAFLSIGNLYANNCQNVEDAVYGRMRSYIGKSCPRLSDAIKTVKEKRAAEYKAGTHPDPKRRVNRIIFASPTIQKALGCKGNPSIKDCQ